MAKTWTIGQSSLADALNGSTGALVYAGLTGLHAEGGTVPGTFVDSVNIYNGTGTTGNFLACFALGGSTDKAFVRASSDGGTHLFGTDESWHGTTIKVIATKSAVAITNIDGDNISKIGLVIAKDNSDNICCVLPTVASSNFANPAVVPLDALYTTSVTLNATTSIGFGSTSLSKIPVPSFDGSAKFMPDVSFALSAQQIVDSEVTLDGLRYYMIGGSLWLKDTIEEVS